MRSAHATTRQPDTEQLILIGRVTGWAGSRWVAGIVAAALVGLALALSAVLGSAWDDFWRWLRLDGGARVESHSTTVRNIGLVVGGFVAVAVAVWRSRVAERQVKASQQSLLNERYQKGAEMLGSDVLSVRLGGIYALRSLTNDHPEQYHLQVMRLLCAFARNPIKDDTIETESPETQPGSPDDSARTRKKLRDDVQDVIEAIGLRSEAALDFERKEAAKINPRARPVDREKLFRQRLLKLDGADLSGGVYSEKLNLSGASLFGADLSCSAFVEGVDLSSTVLYETNLSGARFGLVEVEFSGAFLEETNLSGATLQTDFTVFMDFNAHAKHVNLSSARIHGRKGLTQHQIDNGCFWAKPPPKSINRCAETGEPLNWEGDSG